MFALASGPGVGKLVDLEPIDAALSSEYQKIRMRGGDHQVLDDIFGARPHADAALAAARLAPVGVDSGALQIAAMRDRDGDVFHLDQVFQMNLARIFDHLRASL